MMHVRLSCTGLTSSMACSAVSLQRQSQTQRNEDGSHVSKACQRQQQLLLLLQTLHSLHSTCCCCCSAEIA